MSPGPRFDGAERIPDGVLKLLGKKYSLRILEATIDGPRTVHEIVRDFDLPRTTVYRRLDCLEEQNLVTEDLAFDRGGSHRKVYESNLEELHLRENGESYDLDLELRQTPEEVWRQTWKALRAPTDD